MTSRSVLRRDEWEARARELAYALEVQLYGGRGEFADYSIAEGNDLAKAALERFYELSGRPDKEAP